VGGCSSRSLQQPSTVHHCWWRGARSGSRSCFSSPRWDGGWSTGRLHQLYRGRDHHCPVRPNRDADAGTPQPGLGHRAAAVGQRASQCPGLHFHHRTRTDPRERGAASRTGHGGPGEPGAEPEPGIPSPRHHSPSSDNDGHLCERSRCGRGHQSGTRLVWISAAVRQQA
jgi:hypothetical protein